MLIESRKAVTSEVLDTPQFAAAADDGCFVGYGVGARWGLKSPPSRQTIRDASARCVGPSEQLGPRGQASLRSGPDTLVLPDLPQWLTADTERRLS